MRSKNSCLSPLRWSYATLCTWTYFFFATAILNPRENAKRQKRNSLFYKSLSIARAVVFVFSCTTKRDFLVCVCLLTISLSFLFSSPRIAHSWQLSKSIVHNNERKKEKRGGEKSVPARNLTPSDQRSLLLLFLLKSLMGAWHVHWPSEWAITVPNLPSNRILQWSWQLS